MSKTLHSKMLKLGKFKKKRYILLSILSKILHSKILKNGQILKKIYFVVYKFSKMTCFFLLPQLHMSWSPIRGD